VRTAIEDMIMKTCFLILSGVALFGCTALVSAGEGDTRTMPKADAIYNDIMATLPVEMKARIDSSKTSSAMNGHAQAMADSTASVRQRQVKAAEEKAKRLEGLPDELRVQVEKAMQEMEKRQMERKMEFKDMKRER
jgi:DNA integrity scanning protein DisA with diadenylate cyclase activity